MAKRKIEEVVNDIITIGKRLNWFIKLLKDNKIETYIYSKFDTIYIDTDVITLFREVKPDSKYNDIELKNYLIEIFHKVIEDFKEYNIEFSDEVNFF